MYSLIVRLCYVLSSVMLMRNASTEGGEGTLSTSNDISFINKEEFADNWIGNGSIGVAWRGVVGLDAVTFRGVQHGSRWPEQANRMIQEYIFIYVCMHASGKDILYGKCLGLEQLLAVTTKPKGVCHATFDRAKWHLGKCGPGMEREDWSKMNLMHMDYQ